MTSLNAPPLTLDSKRELRFRGKKEWLVLLLILIGAGLVYVALFPWAFFMGGHLHPIGYWQGWGRMRSKTAGHYFVCVFIYPFTRQTGGMRPQTPVSGDAHLCTPKGEQFYLRLGGDMPPHMGFDTVGKPIHLHMSNWQAAMMLGAAHNLPHLELYGHWGKGELIADDRKTLSMSFYPDGTLRPPESSTLPSQMEEMEVTLHEGSLSDFRSACRA